MKKSNVFIIKILIVILAGLMLNSCGSSDSIITSSGGGTSVSTISGYVIDSTIKHASVKLYLLKNNQLLGECITNDSGEFSFINISLSGADSDDVIFALATGNDTTVSDSNPLLGRKLKFKSIVSSVSEMLSACGDNQDSINIGHFSDLEISNITSAKVMEVEKMLGINSLEDFYLIDRSLAADSAIKCLSFNRTINNMISDNPDFADDNMKKKIIVLAGALQSMVDANDTFTGQSTDSNVYETVRRFTFNNTILQPSDIPQIKNMILTSAIINGKIKSTDITDTDIRVYCDTRIEQLAEISDSRHINNRDSIISFMKQSIFYMSTTNTSLLALNVSDQYLHNSENKSLFLNHYLSPFIYNIVNIDFQPVPGSNFNLQHVSSVYYNKTTERFEHFNNIIRLNGSKWEFIGNQQNVAIHAAITRYSYISNHPDFLFLNVRETNSPISSITVTADADIRPYNQSVVHAGDTIVLTRFNISGDTFWGYDYNSDSIVHSMFPIDTPPQIIRLTFTINFVSGSKTTETRQIKRIPQVDIKLDDFISVYQNGNIAIQYLMPYILPDDARITMTIKNNASDTSDPGLADTGVIYYQNDRIPAYIRRCSLNNYNYSNLQNFYVKLGVEFSDGTKLYVENYYVKNGGNFIKQ